MTESTNPTAPPALETALEIELVHRRLRAVEARVRDLDAIPASAPAGVLAGRFLAGMSGVAAAALVVIAASMVWQTTYPSSAGQTVRMQPPMGETSAQAQPFRVPAPIRPAPRG